MSNDSPLNPNADPHADQEQVVRHAWHHFWENLYTFVAFFSLILLSVAAYEFSPQNNYWLIGLLAGLRVGLIGFFFVTLIRPFNLVVATIVFTVGFFAGMVGLSLWAMFDPITLPTRP